VQEEACKLNYGQKDNISVFYLQQKCYKSEKCHFLESLSTKFSRVCQRGETQGCGDSRSSRGNDWLGQACGSTREQREVLEYSA